MEREVPQTAEGSKKGPSPNVVRLGDWIGPRDELVPFGRRGAGPEPQRPPEEPSPATFAVSEAPPSADDFWGERAGGLHDPLQAPAEDRRPAAARQAARPGRRARPVARLRARRRVVVAGTAAAAVAAITGLALTVGGVGQSAPAGAGTAKVQVASVLSDGVDRILRLDLPLIAPRPARPHAPARRHSASINRGSSRPRSAGEQVHYTPSRPTIAAPSHPVEAETDQPAPAAPTNDSGSRPASSASASSAPVAATGQSGALGPIRSPNG